MKKILLTMLISMILLASCAPQGADDETARGIFGGSDDASGITFIGGVTDLYMTFTEGRPPASVTAGGDFPFHVEVELQNNGESLIAKNDITLSLHGIDPAQFGVTPADLVKKPDTDLLPRRLDAEGNIIEGEIEYVLFGPLNHERQLLGNLPYPVRIDACYEYSTKAVGNICIRDDIVRPVDDKVCTILGNKDFANSAGPVQISNLREAPVDQNTIAITFEVKKSGSGNLFTKGSACDETEITNLDRVWVEVDTGLDGMDCVGLKDGSAPNNGFADLRRGSDTIRCTQKVQTTVDYIKTINFNLEYAYEQSIETEVTVKALG